MATISSFLVWRHLRSDPSFHVLHHKKGRLARSGRGLAYWFLPLSASISKVPMDDRDQTFLFRGRSLDYQDVTAQGTVTFRVKEPEKLAERVDFSIDLKTGLYNKTPLDQIAQLFTQLAQQHAGSYLEQTPVRTILAQGIEPLRDRLREGLHDEPALWPLGLEVVSVRVAGIAPTAELEKALQAPVREGIQQESDEATFQRRALAVEKERAIKENELQNQIELAKREELLIGQQGQNELRRVGEEAEARRIEVEGNVARRRMDSSAEADGIRVVEEARVGAERARMEIYRDLPTQVLVGLAAQELAKNLTHIDHLNLAPEALGPLLTNMLGAATRKLEA